MSKMSALNQVLKGDFFQKNKSIQKDFEQMQFVNCDLQDLDLTDFSFIDCKFIDCNLSMIKLDKTRFLDVEFVNCKISGVNFNLENSGWNFSISLEDCLLSYCSFTNLSFKKSKIYNSKILDCFFLKTDLSLCNCQKTDFNMTTFDEVDFSGADFRQATNYFIDIFQKPNLKGCKFSSSEVVNLLLPLGVVIE